MKEEYKLNLNNINDLKLLLKDNKCLEIVVRKNHQMKKSFKILKLNEKIEKKEFAYFSRKLAYSNLTGDYDIVFKGWKIEEIEYVEDKKTKSLKEMQEEFLSKNKVKKIDDGGSHLSDNQRHSRSHRDSLYDETNYNTKYDGIRCYDELNTRIIIKFLFRKSGKEYGKALKKGISHINYYKVGEELNKGTKMRESTISKKFELGIYTINPKKIDEIEKAKKMMNDFEDKDFYNDEFFD